MPARNANEKTLKLLRDKHNLQIATTLNHDTILRGNLSVKTSIKICGTYEGNIACDGYLHVDKEAKVTADIKADYVIVEGSINGDIYAKHKVELGSFAEVHGDITTHKLKIADGVVFNGKCIMIREDGTVINEA